MLYRTDRNADGKALFVYITQKNYTYKILKSYGGKIIDYQVVIPFRLIES